MNHRVSIEGMSHQTVSDGEEDGAEYGDEASQDEASDEALHPSRPAQS